MSSNTFEIMKVWVPLQISYSSNKTEKTRPHEIFTSFGIPTNYEETDQAWEKASELAKDGWELVGSVPIIGYQYPAMEMPSMTSHPRDLSLAFTTGYVLLFKRRLEETD